MTRYGLARLCWSAIFCVFCAGVSAAEYKPAIEFSSMLDMRFYEDNAGFMVDKLQLVFPPADLNQVDFFIVDENNTIVASSKLRVEKWEDFPAFDGLRAVGPGFVGLTKPGTYTMAFKAGDQFLTTYPFTLNLFEGGDAMNPIKKWYLDGYWPNVAYFSRPTGDTDAPLMFTWWTSQRDVPGGKKGAKCTVHLMQGDREIANGGSAVIISSNTWQSFTRDLHQPKDAGGKYFTLDMLTPQDGDYTMVVKMDGNPVKSYKVNVEGGQIEPLKFSVLGYEPSHSFVSPRRIDTSSRSGSSYKMLDLWWVLRQ